MKRLSLALALALLFVPAMAAIDDSGHDLGNTTPDLGTDRICVFCHTPHNPNTTAGAPPLWNRANGSAATTYTMYSSLTIDMTIGAMDASQMNASTICLSCHDDVVGLGSLFNPPQSGAPTDTTTTISGLTLTNPNAVMGVVLSDDHPVNVTYDTTATGDEDFQTPGTAKLFSNTVQCASCHDPHDTTYAPFLIMDNANSALCQDCHTK